MFNNDKINRLAVFRVDSSDQIGTGHLTRCLTLASSLVEQGYECLFIATQDEKKGPGVPQLGGFSVHWIPPEPDSAPGADGWVEYDLLRTKEIVSRLPQSPDWLIVDHYDIDSRWELEMRSYVSKIMVIDDLADRTHDCDLLLDQNLVASMDDRYQMKLPPKCITLLGPRYALLNREYASLRDKTSSREGPVENVLIFFGGADTSNMTGRCIDSFLELQRPDIEVTVVAGPNHPYIKELTPQIEPHSNIHLQSNLPTLAPLISKADVAIGASGCTNWERLCLGLPSLVITLAPNQVPIASECDNRKLVRWVGNAESVTQTEITTALKAIIEDGLDPAWSRRCGDTVDGEGLDRVCAAITVGRETEVSIRHAVLSDEDLVLDWANDPTTRLNAFNPEKISINEHQVWFRKRIQNLGRCYFYIAETETGIPVGQVRFERQADKWEIHYSIGPSLRFRGLGRKVLRAALNQLRMEEPGSLTFGQVKTANIASMKVFESLEFSMSGSEEGKRVFQCQL